MHSPSWDWFIEFFSSDEYWRVDGYTLSVADVIKSVREALRGAPISAHRRLDISARMRATERDALRGSLPGVTRLNPRRRNQHLMITRAKMGLETRLVYRPWSRFLSPAPRP